MTKPKFPWFVETFVVTGLWVKSYIHATNSFQFDLFSQSLTLLQTHKNEGTQRRHPVSRHTINGGSALLVKVIRTKHHKLKKRDDNKMQNEHWECVPAQTHHKWHWKGWQGLHVSGQTDTRWTSKQDLQKNPTAKIGFYSKCSHDGVVACSILAFLLLLSLWNFAILWIF